MSWHSATVGPDRLAALLAAIRSAGGTVTESRPDGHGVWVTWTLLERR